MNRYGQSITWGPLTAPTFFTGEAISYNSRDTMTEEDIEGAAADMIAMVLHSHKMSLDFEATIIGGSGGTSNFLDLSAGAAISVSGLSGTILAYEAVEKWQLGQPKSASIRATQYPDMTTSSPTMAGTSLDARTPTQTGIGSIIQPGGKIIYGTYGMSHSAGILQSLTLTQSLKITEDGPDPAGTILGAATHGYMRKITMELLATSTAPTAGSTLSLTGAPTTTNDFLIISVEKKMARQRGMVFSIEASWIPPFGSS